MLQITIFDKFPKDWDLVGLEDFVNSNSGIKPGPFGSSITKDCYTKFGYRVYGQEQVIAGDLSVGDYFISKAKFRELHSFAVQANDILLSLVGTVGKILVVKEPFHPGIINPRLIRLRPHYQTNTQYLKHLLESSIVRYQLNKIAQGGTMEVLSATVLRQLRLPKPQLPEQQKIAEIIDAIDRAIALTDTHITKLKKAKAGLLHDLLTRGIDDHGELRDYTRNPELFKRSPLGIIPKDWDVCTVENIVEPNRPVVYGILMPGYGYSGGIPVVKVKDIQNGEIKTDELLLTSPEINRQYFRSQLQSGDLLFTIRGNVGRTAFVPNSLEGGNITQDTARLTITKANPYFVRQYLEMPNSKVFIDLHTLGQAVQGINLRDVRRIPLAIPPLKEQLKIAHVLKIHNSRIRAKEVRRDKLKLLKKGLMSDLLTGRVRVKI